ncbi:arylsulfatase [Glaciecola siphonariae]|uniref:Arylsulfatase n=1 Tax=Glaciecola siphonariae TaxID=521012 RepID=A0ABV9LYC6_9ALTE
MKESCLQSKKERILLNRLVAISLMSSILLACTPVNNPNDGQQTQTSSQQPPNILLILTDDQGYGDLGYTGNDIIETPTLDELHKQGVSFNRFYVSPVCAPTRASLLTGKHYLSTGVFHVTRGGEKMHSDNDTLAELLKPAGYKSGLFGKWHNGLQYPHDPIGQGFDEFYGFSAGHLSEYYDNYLHQSTAKAKTERVQYAGYVADAITDKAIDFIERSAQNNHAFFSMLSFNTPHGPFQAPGALFEKYKAKGLSDVNASIYGMVENIDINIQRVLDTLDNLELLDNTIVLFMSDNGPAFPAGQSRYNAGLKGHKGLVDEGGVRSPLIISWPSKLSKKRAIVPVTQHIDIVPTLLSLANIPYDQTRFDGKDLSPLMFEQDSDWPNRALYTHRFQISKDSSADPIHPIPGAVRTQKFTALVGENGVWKLFDIEADPEQTTDLSAQMPEILADYKQKYLSWYQDITAAHGPYTTLPVELGHSQDEIVELPAHEGLIRSNMKYAHGAGWSHDYLLPTSEEVGEVYWPLKVLTPGPYQVLVDYATEGGDVHAGSVQISAGSQTLELSNIAGFEAQNLSTPRQYYTDEAPDLTWSSLDMGVIDLAAGVQELQVRFAKDSGGKDLWVKQVTLSKK